MIDIEKILENVGRERDAILEELHDLADKNENVFMGKLVEYYAEIESDYNYLPIAYIIQNAGYNSEYMKKLEPYYIRPADLEAYLGQITMHDFGVITKVCVYERENGYYKPKSLDFFKGDERNALTALVTLCMYPVLYRREIKDILYRIFIKHDTDLEIESKELVENFASVVKDILHKYKEYSDDDDEI